jgi:hypothetical protein
MSEKNLEKEKSIELLKESNQQNEALDKVDSSNELADLMEGVDMGNVSEVASEKKKEDPKTSGKSKKTQKKKKEIARPLPSNNVQRRQVLKNYTAEENKLQREAVKLQKSPYEYAEKLKEIRSLRQKVSDFMQLAIEKVSEIYLKLFGKKHGMKKED